MSRRRDQLSAALLTWRYASHVRCACVVLVVLAVSVSATDAAFAQDGPFGLPAPIEKDRPGSVMLHGGGYGLADEIRHEFVRLAGGHDARIVLMPSDECQLGKDRDGKPIPGGETMTQYLQRISAPSEYGRWIQLKTEGHVADVQFLIRDRSSDLGDEKLLAIVERATGVWLPAYDQEWLPKEFAREYPGETSRFQLALRNVVARGGIVGGLGGGMACLPETIIAGESSDADGWTRARLGFGLALLNGVVVDQNFSSWAGRLERMTDLLRNGTRLDRLAAVPGVERRTIGLGVERQTALILHENTIRALGDGRGHVFLKSNGDRTITWHTVTAGEDPLVVQSSSARLPRSTPEVPGKQDGIADPFGVPAPNDPARIGTVILHGGGDTDEIIDLLPKIAGTAKPRLVHCPAARESCRPTAEGIDPQLAKHLERTFFEWRQLQVAGRLADLTFITTNRRDDANRAEFVVPLRQADAMWFCGGDQRPLASLFVDRLRPTLFQQETINIVRRGGVVGGSSAGLAIMADVMIEGGESEDGEPAKAHVSRGLGLLKHVLAEQHFDARAGRIERLTGLLRDHKRLANFSPTCRPKQMIGLAVEEDTALLVQGNRVRVTGKKLAHVFLQAEDPRIVAWHALKPGDAAIVWSTPDANLLELEDWEFGP